MKSYFLPCWLMWHWSLFLFSGGASSHESFPSVYTDQREEDQHTEPAAAEHAGRSAAPLCILPGKHWNTLHCMLVQHWHNKSLKMFDRWIATENRLFWDFRWKIGFSRSLKTSLGATCCNEKNTVSSMVLSPKMKTKNQNINISGPWITVNIQFCISFWKKSSCVS